MLSSVWVALDAAGVLDAAATPPDIVWIIADDMSPDTAAYGMRGVNTPHLDRLAAQGRRYECAYASAPVCGSSRSAFILGTYQTTGLQAHDVENPQPLAAPYRNLPELRREAGWFVTNAAAPGTVRNGRVITRAKTHYNFAHDPAKMYDGTDRRKRWPGGDQPGVDFTEPGRFLQEAAERAEIRRRGRDFSASDLR